MKNRPWTPAEDTAIRDLYPTQSAYEIGEILNRSARMIWNRASELGIKKPRDALRDLLEAVQRSTCSGSGPAQDKAIQALDASTYTKL